MRSTLVRKAATCAPPSGLTRSLCAAPGGLLLLLALILAPGCSEGIHWRNYVYEPVHQDALRDNREMFVYFRHWALVECTRFEEEVLKNPQVLEATKNFYCVPLQIDWDDARAERWGVDSAPAVVILTPQEQVLARLKHPITAAELLKAMQDARARTSAPATSPTTKSVASPPRSSTPATPK